MILTRTWFAFGLPSKPGVTAGGENNVPLPELTKWWFTEAS
jgi:hypothetical protein